MMEERITLRDASKLLQVSKNTMISIAKQYDLDTVMGGKHLRKGLMFLPSELKAFKKKRSEQHMPIKFERSNKSEDTKRIVAWADALTEWPSDEEIDAMTTDVYRRKDVESIIDVRVFRKVKNRKNGKTRYLEPLRLPALSRRNTVGGEM